MTASRLRGGEGGVVLNPNDDIIKPTVPETPYQAGLKGNNETERV